MKRPTKSQVEKLIGLLASYVQTQSGAPIKAQQRAYDRYMAYFEALEAYFPEIPFRDEAVQAELVHRAKARAKLSSKLFRGPGSSY